MLAVLILATIFKVIRVSIKIIGFVDGLLDEHEREKAKAQAQIAKEQAAKAAASKKMNDISNLPVNNVVRINPNGR